MERKDLNVGNYKVSLYELQDVPVIDVSNIEGTWMVRIPVHFQMYGVLNRLLLESQDEDSAVRERANDWLGMFFLNWQNVTGIPNGYYHQALVLLSGAYADPSLLKSSFFGRGKAFYSDVKKLRQSFIKWHNESEKLLREAEKGYDVSKDIAADTAKEISEGKK